MNLAAYFRGHYSACRILSQSGADSYEYAILSWGRTLGTTQLSDLAVSQFVTYIRAQQSDGISPHTIMGRRHRIATLWRHASEEGLAPPYKQPPTIKAPAKIVKAIPREVVGQLVQEAMGLPKSLRGSPHIPNAVYWPAFVAACYESALRRSDLMQLRWEPQGRWTLYQIKTGHPVTAQVSPATLGLLEALSKVSPTLLDVGWDRCSYTHRLKKIGQRIGIHVTPQMLRESAASEAERLHPGSATQLLGHQSDATTRRWYIDYGHAIGEHARPTLDWGPKMAPSVRKRQRRDAG